jgi:hypothetical protein
VVLRVQGLASTLDMKGISTQCIPVTYNPTSLSVYCSHIILFGRCCEMQIAEHKKKYTS